MVALNFPIPTIAKILPFQWNGNKVSFSISKNNWLGLVKFLGFLIFIVTLTIFKAKYFTIENQYMCLSLLVVTLIAIIGATIILTCFWIYGKELEI